MKPRVKSGAKMTASELALAYLAALSSHNPDTVAALVTEDFKNIHTGALGKGCEGRETYRARLAGFFADFPDLHYTHEQIVEEGSRVAITYLMTATSNGRPVRIQGAMFIEVRDGEIAFRTDYWDGATFMQQAGLD